MLLQKNKLPVSELHLTKNIKPIAWIETNKTSNITLPKTNIAPENE